MKLIIAGSRSVNNYDILRLAVVASGIWRKHKRSLEVVCGMARGADALGLQFADRNDLKVHKFPADWDSYGKSAGYRRNAEMAEFADECLILWDGKSKGSIHMKDLALKKCMPLYFYLCKGYNDSGLQILERMYDLNSAD